MRSLAMSWSLGFCAWVGLGFSEVCRADDLGRYEVEGEVTRVDTTSFVLRWNGQELVFAGPPQLEDGSVAKSGARIRVFYRLMPLEIRKVETPGAPKQQPGVVPKPGQIDDRAFYPA